MAKKITELPAATTPLAGTEVAPVVQAGATKKVPVSEIGFKNPMTTAGDIIVGGASGAAGRLAKGTDGKILTMVGGAVAWADPTAVGSGDMLSALLNAEVSVTGGVTLTATAFGKMHVCSGTTADYTVGLPAVSGNAGKLIGFRMSSALTKLVTLDPNGSETVNGMATLQLVVNEAVVLLCNGTSWAVVGQGVPGARGFSAKPDTAVTQNLSTGVFTKLLYQIEQFDTNNWYDASISRFQPARAGYYQITSIVSVNHATTDVGRRIIGTIYKNGAVYASVQFGACNQTTTATVVSAFVYMNGTTDYIEMYARPDTAATASLNVDASIFCATFLGV